MPPTVHADGEREAAAYLERLESAPASAGALLRALAVLDDPQAANQAIERALAGDPGTAGGLLRLANSAYFGVRNEVGSISTAVRVVGRRRLRTLLCHLLAGKLFESMRTGRREAEAVRRRALGAAVVAAKIGEAPGDADELRVAGLLHNVAELALAAEFPDGYAAGTLGLDFAGASARLLAGWRLPPALAAAAGRWETAPDDLPPEERRAADAVHVGALLARAWMAGEGAGDTAARVRLPALQRLGVEERRLVALAEAIPGGVTELERTL